MRTRCYASYAEIAPDAWNRAAGDEQPCLRHEYLYALEASGSATPAMGWMPLPIVVEDDSGAMLGAMPLWLKSHSYGELIYDFAWAQAHERAGLDYYPKLIAALPFTPVTGPRLLLSPDAPRDATCSALLDAARTVAEDTRASSLHWLFTDEHETDLLARHGYLHRTGVQFHWLNRGYSSFDDFLAGFSSEKRKKLRRERRQVQDAGITLSVHAGREITGELWNVFYDFYTANILRHGGMIHLTRDFFHLLGEQLPEATVLVMARRGREYVGAAMNLRGRDALYGRYWGGDPTIHSLHFETCYYTAIDYCIRQGLSRFEGGAGGEHKLARGFLPVNIHSAHWLRHPQLADAVADFLGREQRGVAHYVDELNEHAPFKQIGAPI